MQVVPPPSSDWCVFPPPLLILFDLTERSVLKCSASEASPANVSTRDGRCNQRTSSSFFFNESKRVCSKISGHVMRFGRSCCLPVPTRLFPAAAWHAQRRKRVARLVSATAALAILCIIFGHFTKWDVMAVKPTSVVVRFSLCVERLANIFYLLCALHTVFFPFFPFLKLCSKLEVISYFQGQQVNSFLIKTSSSQRNKSDREEKTHTHTSPRTEIPFPLKSL